MSEREEREEAGRQAARRREVAETLHAIRRVFLAFAVVTISPLTAFAYRFSRGTHPTLISSAFRNALLLVPLAFALIWLALWASERVLAARARSARRSRPTAGGR